MQNSEAERNELATQPDDYEAPRIELMVSQERMEREVHYAGQPISTPG
jgi:hypothetical protein